MPLFIIYESLFGMKTARELPQSHTYIHTHVQTLLPLVVPLLHILNLQVSFIYDIYACFLRLLAVCAYCVPCRCVLAMTEMCLYVCVIKLVFAL